MQWTHPHPGRIALMLAFSITSMNCVADNLYITIKHDDAGENNCMNLQANKVDVAFNTCNDSISQKWIISTASGVYSEIKNADLSNSLCLTSSLNGNSIQMLPCSGNFYTSQTYWQIARESGNRQSLINKNQVDYRRSGYLSVGGGKLLLNKEQVATGKWHFYDENETQITSIKNLGIDPRRNCMDLAPDHKQITINPCRNSDSQQWIITRLGSQNYNIIKNRILDDNTCLFASVAGDAIEMRQCNSGNYYSQIYWNISENISGRYSITNKSQNDQGRNGILSIREGIYLTLNDATYPWPNWAFDGNQKNPKRSITGDVSVLLLNTHFTGTIEISTNDTRKALFGGNGPYSSLKEYINLASNGALNIHEGNTLENIDVGLEPNSCDSTNIRNKAIATAKARGVNADDYDAVYVQTPFNPNCGNTASAVRPSRIDRPGRYINVNGSGAKYWMWTHEFGHTLGFKHSNILVHCPITVTGIKIDDRCELGGRDGGTNDISDTMGGGGGRIYPVNYMYEAGWLPDSQFPIAGNGTYKIDPLLEERGGVQGLRIARDNPDFPYLTLEFRQPNKFDSNWPSNSPFIKGVIVRQIRPETLTSYNVIIQASSGTDDRETAPLMPGRTLLDIDSKKIIKVISTSAEGAIVTISDYNFNIGIPEWSSLVDYTSACQDVHYAGHIWANGWEVKGVKPGSDGEWGVWRRLDSDNFFEYCLPRWEPG